MRVRVRVRVEGEDNSEGGEVERARVSTHHISTDNSATHPIN